MLVRGSTVHQIQSEQLPDLEEIRKCESGAAERGLQSLEPEHLRQFEFS
jgi:hypothetical protein